MAVCHSVVVDHDPKDPSQLIYQAASPDEHALVLAAKKCGIELIHRDKNFVEILVGGSNHRYKIYKEFPFNSDRKRMSVIA